MTVAPRVCTTCASPLPGDAQFCPRCGTRTPTEISGGGTAAVPEPTTASDIAEQRERLQRALGPDFVVEELLGSGGFAQVWAARDRKLNRRVAVKVLHPELVASRSLIERFQREAQAVARLRHPGIVPIYGVGESEGLAYYVMPLIEGQSLREHLRGGALPVAESRRILREAAAAIAVAHKAGIVHRDIKPENLMLDGEERRVLVMDFGIAKATQGTQAGLTGTGMIIGTPAYMSPEQATASKEVDARSDVYSLGVVGFELLAGRPPIEGASVPELVMKQVSMPAPSLAAARPDAPEDLVIAVNRCLAKEPGERWANAGELGAFLEQHATPTGAPTPASRELRRFARRGWRPTRKQVRLGAAAALLVVLAATWLTRRDLFYLALDYWGLGLSRTHRSGPVPTTRGVTVSRAWTDGQILAMGSDLLAVVDRSNPFEGLHLFDGQRWRSFRAPARIRMAAQSGSAVLLFGDSTFYRWTADSIRLEGGLPFTVRFAWSDGRDIMIGGERGELAWRTPQGWQRQPSPRRDRLSLVWGSARNQLYGLGYFAHDSSPDSVVEFHGQTWDSYDPRPPDQRSRWIYETGAVLGDGSTFAGGFDDADVRTPLLLIRDPSHAWRRLDVHGPPGRMITGIWGRTRDTLVVWSYCETACVAEVTRSEWRTIPELRDGPVLGVTGLGGVPHALRPDGTVWARIGGRWAYAAEVPNMLLRYRGAFTDSAYQASAYVGDGVLLGGFAGDPAIEDRSLVVGEMPVRSFRGVAVGHHRAWLLGDDGRVYLADCQAATPCATNAVEALGSGVASLTQLNGGGAVALGARGLLATANGAGVWRTLQLPREAAGESLVTAFADSAFNIVVLGRRHIFSITPQGAVRTTASLPPRLHDAAVVARLPDGRVVVGARVTLAFFRPDGSFTVTELRTLSSQDELTALQPLADGRLIAAVAENSDDPFATGSVLVIAADGDRYQRLPMRDAVRSGVYRLYADENTLAAVGQGRLRAAWPMSALPFAGEGTRP